MPRWVGCKAAACCKTSSACCFVTQRPQFAGKGEGSLGIARIPGVCFARVLAVRFAGELGVGGVVRTHHPSLAIGERGQWAAGAGRKKRAHDERGKTAAGRLHGGGHRAGPVCCHAREFRSGAPCFARVGSSVSAGRQQSLKLSGGSKLGANLAAQASRARSARAPSSHLAMPGNANTASTYACAAPSSP